MRQNAKSISRWKLSSPIGLAILCFAMAGCQRQLMPTPDLYAYAHDNAFDRVPADYRNNQVDVLYVTDRSPDGESKNGPTYGYGRSHSLAFGSCVVEIGRDLSWDDLLRNSLSTKRDRSLNLAIKQVRESARFPTVPYPIADAGPPVIDDPATLTQHAQTEAALHQDLATRLARSERKEVYLYVHGFANTFEDAMFTSAELWHFLGRQGVPISYTWPAGRGLSARGYVYDSVSCDFTVFHFKQLLRAIGRCPQVEKVHIVAHSRGTEVTTAALRELLIEHKHADKTAREALKLGNVVLAAPDLDFDVVQERLGGERVGFMPERVTIYTSPSDRALGLADILTLGAIRLGQVQLKGMPPQLRQLLNTLPINMVMATVTSDATGHSYFTGSPAVSSDIILMLRDNRQPGAEHGRPLKKHMKNFYEIHDDYLRKK
jgi:esterase/lipase superfamily enzyme